MKPSGKSPKDYAEVSLRSQLKAWEARTSELQKEYERIYVLRMDQMVTLLLRWVAYHDMTMEDYKNIFHDADPENEDENLVKKTKELVAIKYEDMRDYFEQLVGFFNFVRSKVFKVQKDGKTVLQLQMMKEELEKLDLKINKVDEARKKIP